MVVVTLVVGIVCFAVGWFIADKISEKRFWDRQDFMEMLNRKF